MKCTKLALVAALVSLTPLAHAATTEFYFSAATRIGDNSEFVYAPETHVKFTGAIPLSYNQNLDLSDGNHYESVMNLNFSNGQLHVLLTAKSLDYVGDSVEAGMHFDDLITVMPHDSSLIGTPGKIVERVHLDGSYGGLAQFDPSSFSGSGVASYTFNIGTSSQSQIKVLSGSDDQENFSPDFVSGDQPSDFEVAIPITFGRASTFGFTFYTSAYLSHSAGFMGVDFSHTFNLNGMSGILDGNGNPLSTSNFDVTSSSGLDYTSAVPEPASLSLLFLGSAATLTRRRRA